jgi:Dullard-like phosphatase family protein
MPVVLEDLSLVKKVLVLDLDETLVHCSFHPPDWHDFCISLQMEENTFDVYVQKRPHVDEFLTEVMSDFYVVIFTASLAQYANPIIDQICPSLPQPQRMFRDSCTFYDGLFVKDLTLFQVPLENVVIVDNNPCSFYLHPANAILSETWVGDKGDNQLTTDILPLLKRCKSADDVRDILNTGR